MALRIPKILDDLLDVSGSASDGQALAYSSAGATWRPSASFLPLTGGQITGPLAVSGVSAGTSSVSVPAGSYVDLGNGVKVQANAGNLGTFIGGNPSLQIAPSNRLYSSDFGSWIDWGGDVLSYVAGAFDGPTARAHLFGNTRNLLTAGAKIVSFFKDNLTTEVAYVDKDGQFVGAVFSASNPTRQVLPWAEVRTLPTSSGDYVQLGSMFSSFGAHSVVLGITVDDLTFSTSKIYMLSSQVGGGLISGWAAVQPISDTGPYGGNDVVLEAANVDLTGTQNSVYLSLRIKRVGGPATANARVNIAPGGVGQNFTWTPLSGTGTSAVGPGFFTTLDKYLVKTVSGVLALGASASAPVHLGPTTTDMASLVYGNFGTLIVAPTGVDQTAPRTPVMSLARTGKSTVVYAGLARFDMDRWASDGANARPRLHIALGDTLPDVLNTVLTLQSNGIVIVPSGALSASQGVFVSGNIATTGTSLVSYNPDGAAAVGTVLDTSASYVTVGSRLLSIRNSGSEKASVDKDGHPTWGLTTVPTGSTLATWNTTSQSLSLKSVSTEFGGASLGMPIFSPQNGDLGVDGNLNLTMGKRYQVGQGYLSSSSGGGTFLGSGGSTALAGLKMVLGSDAAFQGPFIVLDGSSTRTLFQINSPIVDGPTAVAMFTDTSASLTGSGAKLLSIRNSGSEKAYVDVNGTASFNGGLNSIAPDGSPTTGTIINTANRLSFLTAKLLSVQNSGSEVFAVRAASGGMQVIGPPGLPVVGGLNNNWIGVLRLYNGATNNVMDLGTTDDSLSNFPGWIQMGNRGNQAGAFYPLILNPLGGNVGIGVVTTSAGLHVVSYGPDGATAVGTILDTSSSYTSASAKLLSIRNSGSERAYVTKDGMLGVSGTSTTTPGNATLNAAHGRFVVPAASASVVVSSSVVTTASDVWVVLQSNDSTGQVKNVVPSAGYFTVNLVAPTANCSAAFMVYGS